MPKLNYTPKNESVTDYEPAKFSVYNGETELKSGMSLNELTEPFNNGLIVYKHNVRNKQYTVNANLNSNFETSKTHSSNKPDIKIKWEWEFENTNANTAKLNNQLDTILGDLAAKPDATFTGTGLPDSIGTVNVGNSRTDVQLVWTITATQID